MRSVRNFLVFGGSGFIGRHLVEEIVRRSQAGVTIADIRQPSFPLVPQVRFVPCDVRKPINFEPDAVDVVINLAAVHRWPGHKPCEYYETNRGGAQNIVRFCEQNHIQTIWYTSSIAVYGPSEDPVTEDSRVAPVTPYGRSKLQAEEIYQSWVAMSAERRLVIVRPAAIFGPGERGNFTRLARALERRYFVYPGRKDTIKACGYVTDLVRSLFFVDERARKLAIYNFAYPKPYTIDEICRAYGTVAGFAAPVGTVPLRCLLVAGAAAVILGRLGLRNGIHPHRIRKLYQSTNVSPKRLCEWGYKFETDLESALEQWYRQEPAGTFV